MLSVFLSSTSKDLEHCREAAFRAIEGLHGYHCVRMEDFGSIDEAPDDFCRSKLAECDLFVCIAGPLYGSRSPAGSSFTEREFDAAILGKKPCLVFMTAEDYPLPANLIEGDEERKRQLEFRKKISKGRIVTRFSTADEVSVKVVQAIRNWEVAQAVEQVAREKGVAAAPLHAVLAKLDQASVPDAEIPARLQAAADELIELRAQLTRLKNDRPEVPVNQEVLSFIEGGDLDRARAVLTAGQTAARALREKASRDEADLLSLEALLAHLQLDYRNAAESFAQAAALLAPFDREAEWGALTQQAKELGFHGDEFGDNRALLEAIEIFKRALAFRPRTTSPLDWAVAQTNLGVALATLGQRESSICRLEEAVAAYRAALTEYTREHTPLDWAVAQNNLAGALWQRGERESGTVRLEEAVAACRAALTQLTREQAPLDWAGAHVNLGGALRTLGERENSIPRLEEAVAACRAALTELTPERAGLDWAAAQINLGSALATLGERESGTALLEEAVAAYRAALKEYTREHTPLDWAMTQDNLGDVLRMIGERESGTVRLEQAVAACRAALTERTRERVPLQWAESTAKLGEALTGLAQRTSDASIAEEAISDIGLALTIFRESGHAPLIARYTAYLAKAHALLDQLRKADSTAINGVHVPVVAWEGR